MRESRARVSANDTQAYGAAPGRRGFRVSQYSNWEDSVWRLDTETPGRAERVKWDFDLPDGVRSTAPRHVKLLESFRETYWGMLHDGRWFGKALHVGSSAPFSVGMRELFIWMVWRGFSSFGCLDEAAQVAYFEDLPSLIVDRTSFYRAVGFRAVLEADTTDWEAETGTGTPKRRRSLAEAIAPCAEEDEAEDRYSFHQVYIRLTLLYYAFAQGPVLQAAGLDPMPTEPYCGRRPAEQIRILAKHVVKITPPLPDEVALRVLKAVLIWIGPRGDELLSLQDDYWTLKEDLIRKGCSTSTVARSLSCMLQQHNFTLDLETGKPWHKALHRKAAGEFRSLLTGLRDACVLALEFFVGMRVSEICSLKATRRATGGLPECVEVRSVKSGLMELFIVNGLVSKGKARPVPSQWLVGCRPVGSKELPPAVRALCVLERLFAHWRRSENFTGLVGSFPCRHSLPLNGEAVNTRSSALLKGKRRLLREWVDFSDLPDYNEHGENTGAFRDTKGACIRSHHGRKTFAAYLLETRTSLLPAVSWHFKHTNIALTESFYFAPITRLRQEAETARSAATVAYFVEVLAGRKIYGRMADVIYQFFGRSDWDEIRSSVEAFERVEELVEAHGLRLYFSAHGNCLIKARPLEARCRANGSTASWLNDIPQYEARTPSLCAGCGCNVIDASHLEFWRGRAAMPLDEARVTTPEFRVQMFRREQAKKLVQLLEGRGG